MRWSDKFDAGLVHSAIARAGRRKISRAENGRRTERTTGNRIHVNRPERQLPLNLSRHAPILLPPFSARPDRRHCPLGSPTLLYHRPAKTKQSHAPSILKRPLKTSAKIPRVLSVFSISVCEGRLTVESIDSSCRESNGENGKLRLAHLRRTSRKSWSDGSSAGR